ncbi:TOBE domain-containing protein [Marinomonas rhodophyticola]
MTLVQEGGDLSGRIELVEHLGSEAYAHLQLSSDQTIIIKAPARTALKDGQVVNIKIDMSEVILFNENDRVISVIPEEV